ncbi:hypothetical protein ACHAWF_010240 [Thalassiosira exigua]
MRVRGVFGSLSLKSLFSPSIPPRAARRPKMSASSSSPDKLNVKYDLYRGHPNMRCLPKSEMKSIMADFVKEDKESDSWVNYLNYGANAGDERFRLALRSFLDKRTMNDDTGEDFDDDIETRSTSVKHPIELFITNGVSHGLELLCATLTQPGDEVWVERPTYFLASGIFESHGLVVKSLPMLPGDCTARIDIDHLIHMVEAGGVSPPKMIYVIPSYHNPTGVSMTVKERRKLASFALRNHVYLVADEVYHLLDWRHECQEHCQKDDVKSEGLRPAGIVNFNALCSRGQNGLNRHETESGCCISVSSFTKIWAPGIRLGWIEAPSFIVERLERHGYINSQGGVAPLMGRIMTHAIETNLLDSYLDRLRVEYSERYNLMCNLLMEETRIVVLSKNSSIKRQGGYFVWVKLPPNVSSGAFLSHSLENFGVKFMSGERCDPFPLAEGDVSGMLIRSCVRLCFADMDRDDITKATTEFLVAFRSFMNSL